MLVDIANATIADGHQVSVCVTRNGGQLASELRAKVRLSILNRCRTFDGGAFRRFAALVRDQRVDLLHAHGRYTFAFLALIKTAGLLRAPIVFHDHYGRIEVDTSVPRWFRLWGKHWITRYVGVSAKLGSWAGRAGIPPGKIRVIGNALDLDRIQGGEPRDIRQELGIRDNAPLGVVVAGLRHEKGIHVLLDALAWSSRRRSVRVVVIGGERDPAYAGACRDRSASLELDGSLLFLGERPDASRFIRGADFALIPSLSESGPLVLIEYLACGLPIVAAQVGEIAHRAAALGIPTFVAPNDAAALAAGVDQLLGLPRDEWRQRGELGREIARRHFDIRQTMPQWYSVYNEALGAAAA
jgi:glycosyltransferase involved in cell wall biosynthesis